MVLEVMVFAAASGETLVKIGAQPGERHFAKALKHELLGFLKNMVKGGIHRLFDEAAGRFATVADGKKRGAAKRGMDVAQGDLLQVTRQRPAPSMPFFRSHKSLIAQSGHGSSNHHRVRCQHPGKVFGGDRDFLFCQVKQDMEYVG